MAELPIGSEHFATAGHAVHAPAKAPDACCQELSKWSASAETIPVMWVGHASHVDWSVNALDRLMADVTTRSHTFNPESSPGGSPPAFIFRSWPNAPPF